MELSSKLTEDFSVSPPARIFDYLVFHSLVENKYSGIYFIQRVSSKNCQDDFYRREVGLRTVIVGVRVRREL